MFTELKTVLGIISTQYVLDVVNLFIEGKCSVKYPKQ